MTSLYHKLPFYSSQEVDLIVKVFISHLHLKARQATPPAAEAWYVQVRLISSGLVVGDAAVCTGLAHVHAGSVSWQEWLSLPIKYKDLQRGDQMVSPACCAEFASCTACHAHAQEVTICTVDHKPLHSTCIRLDDTCQRVKQGVQCLSMWPLHGSSQAPKPSPVAVQPQVAARKQLESYMRSQTEHIPWLDRLSVPVLMQEATVGAASCGSGSHLPVLEIQLPTFPFPMVLEATLYEEHKGLPQAHPSGALDGTALSALLKPPTSSSAAGALRGQVPTTVPIFTPDANLVWGRHAAVIIDPEDGLKNPSEDMHSLVSVGTQADAADKERRPNAEQLSKIRLLLQSPSYTLPADGALLLWRYRYALTQDPRALAKFLVSVNWKVAAQAAIAVSMLPQWAAIDTTDALRLLFPDLTHWAVREHAVAALRQASEEDLELYLLQLVQALRYEPGLDRRSSRIISDAQRLFLSRQGAKGTEALPPPPSGPLWPAWCSAVSDAAVRLARGDVSPGTPSPARYMLSPLADFLVDRAGRSLSLASCFHWYLTVECEDVAHGKTFQVVLALLHDMARRIPDDKPLAAAGGGSAAPATAETSTVGQAVQRMLVRQVRLVHVLKQVCEIAKGRGNIETKKATLRAAVAVGGSHAQLSDLCSPQWQVGDQPAGALPLPLDPEKRATAIIPGGCTIFQSSVYPVRLQFELELPHGSRPVPKSPAAAGDSPTTASGERAVEPPSFFLMFKLGDDLRQDQLIIQMIRLMDTLWRRVNLNLQLTPYRVLATSPDTGMMEFVQGSTAVERIKSNILAYFRSSSPDDAAPHGVSPTVMDTYVKSCAGYCVITYLLGVGDRHYDNLMLQPSGHFFHVDFGFIFGADPKPMPPPVRTSLPMVRPGAVLPTPITPLSPADENYQADDRRDGGSGQRQLHGVPWLCQPSLQHHSQACNSCHELAAPYAGRRLGKHGPESRGA